NPAPSCVISNLHAGFGDTDDVRLRETMNGKAGDTKTACDAMLLQHRVSGKPEPQALGQDLCLLNAGFGHEHDEFIAAITRHHVRLPAPLLAQAPAAAQPHTA